jgi:DNA-binding NarL/FixJ family response regulator
MNPAPHFLLVDDHAIMIDGLRMVLAVSFPSATFAAASSLQEALALDGKPDVAVLDLILPGLSGMEGVALLQRRWPQIGIVMLSSQDDEETRKMALARGANVFISKAEAGSRLADVVRLLLVDEDGVSAETTKPLAKSLLTPRQCEVLELMSQGLTNKAIAKKLSLSDNTVRRHLQNIFSYLGVSTRTEAVFAAHQIGVLDRMPRPMLSGTPDMNAE